MKAQKALKLNQSPKAICYTNTRHCVDVLRNALADSTLLSL
jgi:hypothetical protein